MKNPSFEGEAQRGKPYQSNDKLLWIDCNETWGFLAESAYDVHTAHSNFWNITNKPSHGKSFISLVVRELETFEGVSQKLTSPLSANKCYELEIDICKSEEMQSDVPNKLGLENFNTDAILRISFQNQLCQIATCISKSEPISNVKWKRYKFQFQPKEDYDYITLSAFWVTPVLKAYNGNILIDNFSNIKEIDCSESN